MCVFVSFKKRGEGDFVRLSKSKKKRLNSKGFTFVELLVAIAILGVCVAPIMSAFVVSSRMNLRGRRKEQALTVAQSIVEGVKAHGIVSTLNECKESNTDDFTVIPENGEGTKISHTVTRSTLVESTINVAGYNFWIGQTFEANAAGENNVVTKSNAYTFKLENILMGATYYDAVVTIDPNYDKEFVAAYVFEETFNSAGMSNLKYYNVVSTVMLHGETEVLATYDGTFVDQD